MKAVVSNRIYLEVTDQYKEVLSKELTYTLVAPEEADFEHGKISTVSPIGKGLLGHAEGEEVEIKVPAGILNYKVVKISR